MPIYISLSIHYFNAYTVADVKYAHIYSTTGMIRGTKTKNTPTYILHTAVIPDRINALGIGEVSVFASFTQSKTD